MDTFTIPPYSAATEPLFENARRTGGVVPWRAFHAARAAELSWAEGALCAAKDALSQALATEEEVAHRLEDFDCPEFSTRLEEITEAVRVASSWLRSVEKWAAEYRRQAAAAEGICL